MVFMPNITNINDAITYTNPPPAPGDNHKKGIERKNYCSPSPQSLRRVRFVSGHLFRVSERVRTCAKQSGKQKCLLFDVVSVRWAEKQEVLPKLSITCSF